MNFKKSAYCLTEPWPEVFLLLVLFANERQPDEGLLKIDRTLVV